MRQAVIGIAAHVDAGKTTLAEALLAQAGAIRSAGRVDQGTTHLDTDPMERDRGITIFSSTAPLSWNDVRLTLVDTPGHSDFAGETERALAALDCAVLVVSATDGVTGHTRTLWRLLERAGVPVVVFVNKCDLATAQPERVVASLRQRLGGACVDWELEPSERLEACALTNEEALDELLETGTLAPQTLQRLVARRDVAPVVRGSALKGEGVRQLLDLLAQLTPQKRWPEAFGARVYNVTHDERGERLTWLKVTGGSLAAKTALCGPAAQGDARSAHGSSAAQGDAQPTHGGAGGNGETRPTHGAPAANGETWHEKVNQIRRYSGRRYEVVSQVQAGEVCAVTGLTQVFAGDGLGAEAGAPAPLLRPVLACSVECAAHDPHEVYAAVRLLAEEDPLLQASWNEEARQIQLLVMGPIQQEVLAQQLRERFGLQVGFGPGRVLYRETVTAPVDGVGHFEPLRHYAEVRLRLEPLPRGTGLTCGSRCATDDLDLNWQRLILTHVREREHPGTLLGAPVTDLRVTLTAGRAHAKHTEGGDFRQATYRALRQALMTAREKDACALLEPWMAFELEVPETSLGRALGDLQRMGAQFGAPACADGSAVLEGLVPASELGDYAVQVAAYTGGEGHLSCTFAGYQECHDAERVLAETGYDPEGDHGNPADSVFCSHGAGHPVPWRGVPAAAHVPLDPSRLTTWRSAEQVLGLE